MTFDYKNCISFSKFSYLSPDNPKTVFVAMVTSYCIKQVCFYYFFMVGVQKHFACTACVLSRAVHTLPH